LEADVDKRFIPLNALIAYCAPIKTGWPRPLYDAGYVLSALEFPAPTIDGRVDADVVAWSSELNRIVLGEAKSGANVDAGQAQRYGEVQANALVQILGVTISSAGPVRVQPIYSVLDEHSPRIEQGLNNLAMDFPVVAIGSSEVKQTSGTFDCSVLATKFSEPIVIPGPPPGIITVDRDSPDEDFDRIVQVSLVSVMAQHNMTISIPALAEDAIPYLALYPNGYRQALIRKVEDAARRAVDASPESFAFEPRSGTRDFARIQILDSPEARDPRGRTQGYQALYTRFSAPRRGRRTIVSDDQLSLFGSDMFEEELAAMDLGDESGNEEVSDGPE
jgi:hypothetical protein